MCSGAILKIQLDTDSKLGKMTQIERVSKRAVLETIQGERWSSSSTKVSPVEFWWGLLRIGRIDNEYRGPLNSVNFVFVRIIDCLFSRCYCSYVLAVFRIHYLTITTTHSRI